MGMKSVGGAGEIVEVQGGHVVRSTGRKDRHSKVFTARGPRDRRVRLSAHTAIQFYDVQDRLGYDRPSKAVDWLILKAKSAIDNLAQLPPWNPSSPQQQQQQYPVNESSFVPTPPPPPPPMATDSDPIEDTMMKSFFPTTCSASSSSTINFQSYPSEINPVPTQGLGLSLYSFQDQFDQTNFSSTPLTEQSVVFGLSSFGQSHRGTLHSSFSSSPPSSSSSSLFGLPIFSIPARIQGHDDVHNAVVSNTPPSSSSPNSTHHHN